MFEAPGLTALLVAHRALEEAVLTKQQNRFKPEVGRKWTELVYEGFYHDPLKYDLEAFLASTQRMVNGNGRRRDARAGACIRSRSSRRTSCKRRRRRMRRPPTGASRKPKGSSGSTA